MGDCFTVPDNTRHPSIMISESPAADKESEQQTKHEEQPKSEEKKAKPDTTDTAADGNANSTKQPRKGGNQMIHALTSKKDYSAATKANKEENGYKRNTDHDVEITYADDGATITTKANGITVNEYGQQRYDDGLTKDEVLDDILIT